MQESRYNIWQEFDDSFYVFNGISGALLRIPIDQRESLRRLLAGEDETSCSPETLAHLVHGFMLIPDGFDELALLAERYRTSRWDANSFALTVVTSLGCNFDCPYCFEAKHPSLLDEEIQDLIVGILDCQLPKIRRFNVTWFGGEPLMGKDGLFALSDTFIKRCSRFEVEYAATVITNGYLLDEKTCADLRDRRVGSVQVGLDGPPEVHDRMRPLISGRGTFWKIIKNLHHAVRYFPVTIRTNIDVENFDRVEELFEILAKENLAGKLAVYPGQLVADAGNLSAPSAHYKATCFTNKDFAQARLHFLEIASRYGLSIPSLPGPTGAPCTAVRANELVVGSRGELYKCWDSVGDHREVIGHIRDYENTNGRLSKWLKYNPFDNEECRGCIALPVCMGGCAHHAFNDLQYENRCGAFRHSYRQEVLRFVKFAEKHSTEGLTRAAGLVQQMETK